MREPIVMARTAAGADVVLRPEMANRHGLIAGATGTGKTVSLQVMAEAFSRLGVPSVMADVKGDLAGLGAAGVPSPKLMQRLQSLKIDPPAFGPSPVVCWDLFGVAGHPVRATVSDMGPLLFSRLLGLNETQAGVLTIVFKIADDNGMLLLDLKDLRSMLQFVGEQAKAFTTEYGNISAASVGTIQRGLLALDEQGGGQFFGEPMLDIDDLIQTAPDGRGVINVLAADRLMTSPKLYATFLLWLMAELFENLPEVGDLEQPKLVFFFDEAHLLFDDAPRALVERIEQVVRLIRSKGVGVYFVTQNPLDIPDTVLGQLGNRVQHALRAFTPRDQKAVRAAAETMRANTTIDTEKAITELGVGEALVSFLDAKGSPSPVERAFILPPASRIGPLTEAERAAIIAASVVRGHYETTVDRESAYETIKARTTARQAEAAPPASRGGPVASRQGGGISDLLFGSTGPRGGKRDGLIEAAAKSAARSVGSSFGRQIMRGVLGSMFGKRR